MWVFGFAISVTSLKMKHVWCWSALLIMISENPFHKLSQFFHILSLLTPTKKMQFLFSNSDMIRVYAKTCFKILQERHSLFYKYNVLGFWWILIIFCLLLDTTWVAARNMYHNDTTVGAGSGMVSGHRFPPPVICSWWCPISADTCFMWSFSWCRGIY